MVKMLTRVIYRKNRKRGNGAPIVISYYGELWDYDGHSETNKELAVRRVNHLGRKYGKSMLIAQKGLKETGHGNTTWYSLYYPAGKKAEKNKKYMKI